ncbi:DUF1835 domain-containing protein [Paenibacillus gansuensis]|uniref:DUF1835 domain-containing protein n=1 Tax=Paenibacillus gansuensis TaxID=306542 RepID=A0ABW5PHY8_9BACL
MKPDLHITNGDSVADKLKRMLQGENAIVMAWREMLTDGPIQADLDEEAFTDRRAAWFEAAMGVPADEFKSALREQQALLGSGEAYSRIVLWFEHDLFDQALLLYLLDRLRRLRVPAGKLQLLQIGSFPGIEPFYGLGQLSEAQLKGLLGSPQPVTAEQLGLGAEGWRAYASADPEAVPALLRRDLTALPFLSEALKLHLERFPDPSTGLGRVERQTLALLAAEGPLTLAPLFQAVSRLNTSYGLGDLQCWCYLDRMRSGSRPLIAVEGPAKLPRYGPAPKLDAYQVSITESGLQAMRGEANAADLNGIDRWLGGIHLMKNPKG